MIANGRTTKDACSAIDRRQHEEVGNSEGKQGLTINHVQRGRDSRRQPAGACLGDRIGTVHQAKDEGPT